MVFGFRSGGSVGSVVYACELGVVEKCYWENPKT